MNREINYYNELAFDRQRYYEDSEPNYPFYLKGYLSGIVGTVAVSGRELLWICRGKNI